MYFWKNPNRIKNLIRYKKAAHRHVRKASVMKKVFKKEDKKITFARIKANIKKHNKKKLYNMNKASLLKKKIMKKFSRL